MIKILFFLMLLFLPIDGCPPGMAVLREFGARPVNFLLLIFIFIALIRMTLGDKFYIIRNNYASKVYPLILLFTANIFVIYLTGARAVLGRSPDLNWSFQFAMILWFFVSIYLWLILYQKLKILEEGYRLFLVFLIVTSCLNLAVFYLDIFNVLKYGNATKGLFTESLYFLRGKNDVRPSGFATEPSTFGSWVMFIWPLLYFYNRKLISAKGLGRISRWVGILCILSGWLSMARTFMIVFLTQVLIYFFIKLLTSRRKMWVLIQTGALFILGTIVIVQTFISDRLISIFAATSNLSSAARLGSAITALYIFQDHLWFGVGLGQFTNYYVDYVPRWALISHEVQGYLEGGYMAGDVLRKVNAFNLFARIGAETGIITLIAFLIYFSSIIFSLWKRVSSESKAAPSNKGFYYGCLLSVLGGVSWWMSQDLFSYQPGIFSLAFAIYFIRYTDEQNMQVVEI